MTIQQAIRNAVASEEAAARFYAGLAPKANSHETREFLLELSRQEERHATELLTWASQRESQGLPHIADAKVDTVETAPGWNEAGTLGLIEALTLAVEAENNAALYYDAMSDCFEGDTGDFFRRMMKRELGHAQRIRQLLERLKDQ